MLVPSSPLYVTWVNHVIRKHLYKYIKIWYIPILSCENKECETHPIIKWDLFSLKVVKIVLWWERFGKQSQLMKLNFFFSFSLGLQWRKRIKFVLLFYFMAKITLIIIQWFPMRTIHLSDILQHLKLNLKPSNKYRYIIWLYYVWFRRGQKKRVYLSVETDCKI